MQWLQVITCLCSPAVRCMMTAVKKNCTVEWSFIMVQSREKNTHCKCRRKYCIGSESLTVSLNIAETRCPDIPCPSRKSRGFRYTNNPLARMVTFTSEQSHRGCKGRKQNNNGRFQLLQLRLNKLHNGAQCWEYILDTIDDGFF